MLGWPTIALVTWALVSLAAGLIWARYRRPARRPTCADIRRIRERQATEAAQTYGDVPFFSEGERDV